MLTKDNAPETPDPKEQKIYRSFVAKIQFVANWVRYDVSFAASQLARFCASAGVSHWAALHHVMGYLSNNAIQVPNSFIGVGSIMDWMVLLIPIGETVSHVGLQQDCWHDTTNLSCCGDQECKRQLHCQLRKPNIIQHLKLHLRSSSSQLDTKHGLTTEG